ncbi:ABC transporter substrate-binding protein [Lacrimispora indolis]|uniref:ABC transporter substrate-binding protein n=1 Tax=Lacrimispora indolis TaxID=69825 RepID=UPI0035695D89
MCLYRRALTGVLAVLLAVGISACGGKAKPGQEMGVSQKAEITQEKASAPVWEDMRPERSMKLSYAKQFSVDYYDGGYDLIQVQDDSTCLVVPEGAAVPEGLPASITVLQKPLDHVYLAATSAMDLIAALGRVDRITLSGTKESGWYVDAARQAMEDGTLSYAGKYSAPDYEQILSSGCDLALESTMIYHVPDVKAQLEQLKIPVFVERSSYEEHPLGRMEWIRLYGVLFDAEETAEQLFQEQVQQLDTVLTGQSVGKSAAFFYITSNGAVNVRKPGDYVAKMIELAGGSYVPKTADTDENALSTMNMQMETFYAEAKEADCLIYNSTIEGELQTMDELLQKSPLLKDFKAVKNGNVWCTGKNMFQETMGLGDMILDLHAVFSEAVPDENSLHYLHRLR